jgi:chitin synthase
MIQYIFLLLQIVFNWFLVGNFYLTVYYVIFYSLQENTLGVLDTRRFYDKYGRTAEFVFASIYILVFVVQIVLGMGNKYGITALTLFLVHTYPSSLSRRPKHVSWTYRTISWYYMILVIVTMTVSALTLIESGNVALNPENIALGTAIFGVYFIAAALHCELHHVLLSFLQYSLMLPVMIVSSHAI